MRHVKITGGPSPATVKVTDSETGVDLTTMFLALECDATKDQLLHVKLTAFAELDVEAEVSE